MAEHDWRDLAARPDDYEPDDYAAPPLPPPPEPELPDGWTEEDERRYVKYTDALPFTTVERSRAEWRNGEALNQALVRLEAAERERDHWREIAFAYGRGIDQIRHAEHLIAQGIPAKREESY